MTIRKISEPENKRKLELVTHPEIPNQNLVKLGMISDVQIQDDRITITLALPSINVPVKQILIDSIKDGISDFVKNFDIDVIP